MSDPVDLRGLPLNRAVPQPFRLGGIVRGALGGSQSIGRLGDRWSWSFRTPAIDLEPQGRRWSALFDMAEKRGALIGIDQPGLRLRPLGSPVVRVATAAGRTVSVAGMQPHAAVLAGQWVSVIADGRRYSDKIVAPAEAAADGTADLIIKNLLRVPLKVGDLVELSKPCVQGTVDLAVDSGSWELDRFTSFSFTITEDA